MDKEDLGKITDIYQDKIEELGKILREWGLDEEEVGVKINICFRSFYSKVIKLSGLVFNPEDKVREEDKNK